jgi:hypothetical protein
LIFFVLCYLTRSRNQLQNTGPGMELGLENFSNIHTETDSHQYIITGTGNGTVPGYREYSKENLRVPAPYRTPYHTVPYRILYGTEQDCNVP